MRPPSGFLFLEGNKEMKLNKAYDTFRQPTELHFNNILNKPYADLVIKYRPEVIYRIHRDNDMIDILTLIGSEFTATKEVRRDYLKNNENYIFVDNQIAYSAVIVTNLLAEEVVNRILPIVASEDFDFGDFIKCKTPEDYKEATRWLDYDFAFSITESSVVKAENKILKDLRLQQINLPFIRHTAISDMVFVKFELHDVHIEGEELKKFRKIANKAVVSLFNSIFNNRAVMFRVFSTNEPYKTLEVVRNNGKYLK